MQKIRSAGTGPPLKDLRYLSPSVLVYGDRVVVYGSGTLTDRILAMCGVEVVSGPHEEGEARVYYVRPTTEMHD